MAAFERIGEHLYRYEDTCAVYVVINPDEPDRATLVAPYGCRVLGGIATSE